jgi:hypothetical protein
MHRGMDRHSWNPSAVYALMSQTAMRSYLVAGGPGRSPAGGRPR